MKIYRMRTHIHYNLSGICHTVADKLHRTHPFDFYPTKTPDQKDIRALHNFCCQHPSKLDVVHLYVVETWTWGQLLLRNQVGVGEHVPTAGFKH